MDDLGVPPLLETSRYQLHRLKPWLAKWFSHGLVQSWRTLKTHDYGFIYPFEVSLSYI